MKEWTAEDLSQRILDLRVIDGLQLQSAWAEFRTRNVTFEDFKNYLLRKQLLTNFQLEKVLKGDREGFFYGKYRVLYIGGAGTFARVFRAVDTQTNRVVAVKVLRRRYRNEPEQVELFLREARMGERLRHFNIVRIYDVSNDIRAPFMVMEFVEGPTLREFMKTRKKLDLGTSLNLFHDLASGLDYARKLGVTHRDLKLSNVLVTSTGRAKLVDFGLATIAESDDKLLTASPNARSIDYVALERGTGVRKHDPRSDIYFSGCILYNMLTGVPPLYETRDRLQRMNISRFDQIPPIATLEPEVPLSVVAMVNRAMCFQPANRYQDYEEMLSDIEKAKAMLGITAEREAAAAEAGTVAPVPREAVDNEGLGRTVMFVESQVDLQDTLRDQLKKRGYRVLITADPARAIERFMNDPKTAQCVVFSTQALGFSAVKAFNELGATELTAHIPAILLADPAQTELTEAAKFDQHRVSLPMPLKVKALREKLLDLLDAAEKKKQASRQA